MILLMAGAWVPSLAQPRRTKAMGIATSRLGLFSSACSRLAQATCLAVNRGAFRMLGSSLLPTVRLRLASADSEPQDGTCGISLDHLVGAGEQQNTIVF